MVTEGLNMKIRKIVVGVDFSSDSTGAVKLGTALCLEVGAELLLVHAGAVALEALESRLPSVREWERLISVQAIEDKNRLEAMLGDVLAKGVTASCQVVDGSPADALAAAALSSDADLLIVGTHGLGAAKHFLLGSVAERVVRLATCNVLVTREGADATIAPRRILLATDFSEHAEMALRIAVDFAGQGGTIDVVHFWDLSPMVSSLVGSEATGSVVTSLGEELERDALQRGARLIAKHQREGITLSFKAVRGKAAAGIVQKQKRSASAYDLVVTGSHGHRGLRRFFLGSVAEKVVRNASCSVLVVHRG
jgi:nucleotide-binding universal stress UspA family protein